MRRTRISFKMSVFQDTHEREVNKHSTTTTTTTQHHQSHRVGALSPMPACLGIGGHTGGSRQGHPRYTSASAKEGRGWPDKRMTTNTMREETKTHTGTPCRGYHLHTCMVAERYKIDTGKIANLIEFDKEAHDKILKEHGTESSN